MSNFKKGQLVLTKPLAKHVNHYGCKIFGNRIGIYLNPYASETEFRAKNGEPSYTLNWHDVYVQGIGMLTILESQFEVL